MLLSTFAYNLHLAAVSGQGVEASVLGSYRSKAKYLVACPGGACCNSMDNQIKTEKKTNKA